MIKIEMKYQKSTKNTHVYQCDEESACITSLYVKREALSSKPGSIVVTIEEERESKE